MEVVEPRKAASAAQVKLNLPTPLHREIKIRAAKNVRSLNGEMVYLMQKAIEGERQAQGGTA